MRHVPVETQRQLGLVSGILKHRNGGAGFGQPCVELGTGRIEPYGRASGLHDLAAIAQRIERIEFRAEYAQEPKDLRGAGRGVPTPLDCAGP